ncbi:hypothetical protein D3C78_1774190 [compost metagenome]
MATTMITTTAMSTAVAAVVVATVTITAMTTVMTMATAVAVVVAVAVARVTSTDLPQGLIKKPASDAGFFMVLRAALSSEVAASLRPCWRCDSVARPAACRPTAGSDA